MEDMDMVTDMAMGSMAVRPMDLSRQHTRLTERIEGWLM